MAFTFAAMGKIAKSAGQVRPAHVAATESLVRKIGLSAADRRIAIDWFNAGKQGTFDFDEGAARCKRAADSQRLLQMSLTCMVQIAWVEGPPKVEERAAVTELAALIDATPEALAAIDTSVRAQRMGELPADLRAAYETLGVEPWIDDDALTLAYRRLLNRHHPDKFAQATARHAMTTARLRTIALRDAYDLIRCRRSAV